MRHFDKCKCCLEDGDLRDMWAEYVVDDGETEIYGQLLNECFAFSWQEATDYAEQICESCIKRLHDALAFRKEVISAKEILDEVIEQNIKPNVKVEVQETGDNDEEASHGDEQQEYLEMESSSLEQGEEGCKAEMYDDSSQESLYYREDHPEMILGMTPDDDDAAGAGDGDMQVEYLEDDIEAETVSATKSDQKSGKLPKKRKKSERAKNYKQYSTDDMETALEKVINNQMSRAEAAAIYNIPLKTLGAKLRLKEAGEDHEDVEKKAKQQKFYDEIKLLLTYTNATPFKSKVSKFFCAYCFIPCPAFMDPQQLRVHTRSQHAHERVKNVEMFMRPQYLNEIIKLDIENLHCTVCTTPIEDWNAMFIHLREKHEVVLDEAYNKAIPFVLQEADLHCALCTSNFSHFHMLDTHMNAHYDNYICVECGDTFLSESRLKRHMEIHSTERFPCEDCGKVFNLEKYRKKHHDGVHLKGRKFKCHYCSEVFAGDYLRHLHVVSDHKEKVKYLTCEFCGINFTWRPYYLKHMRLNHTQTDKKFKCKLCGKEFHQKHEMKNHEDWHKGLGFTCSVCDKKFSSKNYLQKHIATHDTVVVLFD